MSKIMFPRIILATIVGFLLMSFMGCSRSQQDQKAQAQETPKSAEAGHDCGMQGSNKAPNPGLSALMTADSLYACPMHPQFVTADLQAKCTICGMSVEKMSAEKVAEFRVAHSHQQTEVAPAQSGCQGCSK